MNRLEGKTPTFFGLGGAALCILALALAACDSVANFGRAQTRAVVSRVRTDQRSLATAIEAYYLDNNMYPAWGTAATGPGNTQTYNYWVCTVQGHSGDPATLPCFLLNDPTTEPNFHTLTTPVSYITSYEADPLSRVKRVTFMYWSVYPGEPEPSGKIVGWSPDLGTMPQSVADRLADVPPEKLSPVKGIGWILVSAGPDGDYDLAGDWDVYNPAQSQPSPRLLAGTNRKGSAFTYDPTNGTRSNGDIWRVKQ